MTGKERQRRRRDSGRAPAGQKAPGASAARADAFALHRAGRLADAIKAYQRILRRRPKDAQTLQLLGLAEHQAGRHARAATLIERAVALGAGGAPVLSNLGEAYRALGRLADAERSYRAALALAPGFAGVHYNLGIVLAAEGRNAEAIASYRRALGLVPDDADTLNNLGNALLEGEAVAEAEACFRRALALRPDHWRAHNNLAIAEREQGRIDDAIAGCRRAIALDGKQAEAHCNLGVCLRAQGDDFSARASFRRALALRPGFAEARYMHALVHRFQAGGRELAAIEAALAAGAASEEARSYLLFAAGKALDDVGRYDEAFARFQEANRLMAARGRFDRAWQRSFVADIEAAFARPTPAPAAAAGAVPVFVVGLSRSGKTLVESVLAEDPAVHAAGESPELPQALSTVCAAAGLEQPFPAVMAALGPGRVRAIGRRYMAAMAARAPGARIHVNTSPGSYPYVGLILQALPGARVIVCERDGLDNGLYIYFSRYRRGHAYAYDLADIGVFYRDFHRLMGHWRKVFGRRLFTVQYEALVGDPRATSAALRRFAGAAGGGLGKAFTTDEIGHARHYASHLGPLAEVLHG